MKPIVLLRKPSRFLFILILLFMLAWPGVPCSGGQGQEKPLEKLLKRGLDALLGEGTIDSMQIVEESDYRLIVEVAYSGIKKLAGHTLVVEPFGYNHAALPGFEYETRILSQKQGTLRLGVLFRGGGAQPKAQSTALEARLYIPPKNLKASKTMEYFKDWTAAPSGATLPASGGFTSTTGASGEGVVIDPVPMFKPEELAPAGNQQNPNVKEVRRKAIVPIKAIGQIIQPAAAAISPNDYYRIEAKCSGKCLDVSGVSMENGANVHQWEWVGGANQLWKFVPLDDGCYEIVAKHSGKCLDVAEWSKEKEGNVWQWDIHGGDNQRWRLIPLGDGYYKIVSKWSGKCLDVQWGSNQNAANVWQYDDIGSDAQKWKLIVVR